jgi:hypothetical protein
VKSAISIENLMTLRTIAASIFCCFTIQCFNFGLFVAAAADARLNGIVVQKEQLRSYERGRDFGRWSSAGGGCLDVRGQVLQAESLIPVTRDETGSGVCEVLRGRWRDPYTATTITDGGQMDVDHMVPLKEAWESGAMHWPKEKRKLYANFLDDPLHLIAVDKRANRSKSDRDPAEWMPPNAAYHCRYLEAWIGVKRRWALTMDRVEFSAIDQMLAACR